MWGLAFSLPPGFARRYGELKFAAAEACAT
jgi:hypothetical protein